jgi:hypothetical protein
VPYGTLPAPAPEFPHPPSGKPGQGLNSANLADGSFCRSCRYSGDCGIAIIGIRRTLGEGGRRMLERASHIAVLLTCLLLASFLIRDRFSQTNGNSAGRQETEVAQP